MNTHLLPALSKQFRVVASSELPVMDLNSLQYHSYKCQICPFYAPDQETVANHFQLCHTVEQHIAIENLRNTLFVTTATLDAKTFKCGACDYTTYKRGNLNAHFVGKHTMERPFPCPHCEYRAKTERHLQAHILTHGGDTPPFRCTQCTYETEDRTELVKHKEEVHDSDKVYSCEQCPYKARTSDYLAKHRVTQHTPMNERQYECQHCSKRFAIESLLRRHLKKHLDNTRHQCSYCGNLFKDIRRHKTRCAKASGSPEVKEEEKKVKEVRPPKQKTSVIQPTVRMNTTPQSTSVRSLITEPNRSMTEIAVPLINNAVSVNNCTGIRGGTQEVGNVLPSTLLQYSSVLTECLSGMFSTIHTSSYPSKGTTTTIQAVPVTPLIPSTVLAGQITSAPIQYVTANVPGATIIGGGSSLRLGTGVVSTAVGSDIIGQTVLRANGGS